MSKRLHVKYPLFLSDFNETWIFTTDFWKKLKHQIWSKSVHWEPSCSMRTDRRTDMRALIVAFRKFEKAPIKFRRAFQVHVAHLRSSLCRYDLKREALHSLEREMQRLIALGYRWSHTYTQCVLQALLRAIRYGWVIIFTVTVSLYVHL